MPLLDVYVLGHEPTERTMTVTHDELHDLLLLRDDLRIRGIEDHRYRDLGGDDYCCELEVVGPDWAFPTQPGGAWGTTSGVGACGRCGARGLKQWVDEAARGVETPGVGHITLTFGDLHDLLRLPESVRVVRLMDGVPTRHIAVLVSDPEMVLPPERKYADGAVSPFYKCQHCGLRGLEAAVDHAAEG